MKVSPEILNELKAISPLLASMEKVNVFQVPAGYFIDLPQRISDYAILNNTSVVDNIAGRKLQQVPQGYFDTLSDSIMTKIKATYGSDADQELQSLSPFLFSLKNENVFTIPENYFDTLSDSIVAKVKITGNETAHEELQSLSPMLYSLKDENVFAVPKNYFESFADSVSEKLKPQPAKVITMSNKKSWWKYAAAAVVTGLIALGSFQIFTHVNDKNTNVATAYINESLQYKTQDDLTAGIAKLSDADIIKYLEKNGNVMDNELLTNNTDVSEMPSQTDYLNDENTLNEYLDKIDAETDNKSKP